MQPNVLIDQAPASGRRGEDAAPDPDFMLSLARGLSVIRAFQDDRARPLAEISRATGLSRASTRRCLHTLSVLGYATTRNGSYALTPAVLLLGQAYLGADSIARSAQPVLERLSAALHESSSLAVLEGDEIVYLARASIQRILSVGLAVGSRLPAAATSMGRVLIAGLPDPDRVRIVRRIKLVRHTPRTIADRPAFRAEIERVRSLGHALVDQELEIGLRSLAVPVHRSDGAVVAAINVGVHAGRLDASALRRDVLPKLQAAASEVARALSGL